MYTAEDVCGRKYSRKRTWRWGMIDATGSSSVLTLIFSYLMQLNDVDLEIEKKKVFAVEIFTRNVSFFLYLEITG